MTTSTQWHLLRRPRGEPVPEDFRLVEEELAAPGDGEVLVRNLYLSVDPYMRGRMNDAKSYVPPFALDEPMTGDAVGVVEAVGDGASDETGTTLKVGDTVVHPFGWRTHAVLPGRHARAVDPALAPPSAFLGVLGMTGRTAYAGLLRTAELREGDAVFVSAAAGAVGSLVGQIARLKGASLVVGSAGGPDKVRWAMQEAGLDAVVDYKSVPIGTGLRQVAPEGIDVYFDNVGGDHLEAALTALRRGGRVALCGAISAYNATQPQPGPRNLALAIGKRLTLRGFIVGDHADLRPAFEREMAGWLADGAIAWRETTVDGIESAVEGFRQLLAGGNTGKMVIRL
ncbi:NADP-dependent oxidoreductase [Pedococcus sp. 5OH_020]|uniref:NADP-dependent oxidoreductase n=1 Tax=Pedococcus sp. 5OH_020 TaxID=2989814 RepID=UPI0022E9D5A2|nr:NADP-dependent oxidoreductase [Pedococcus sp. 5OH_020]